MTRLLSDRLNSEETTVPARDKTVQAVRTFVAVMNAYPPEVMNDPDGAWRIGGSAKVAWREAARLLREAVDSA